MKNKRYLLSGCKYIVEIQSLKQIINFFLHYYQDSLSSSLLTIWWLCMNWLENHFTLGLRSWRHLRSWRRRTHKFTVLRESTRNSCWISVLLGNLAYSTTLCILDFTVKSTILSFSALFSFSFWSFFHLPFWCFSFTFTCS